MEEQIFQKRRKAKEKDFVDYSLAMEAHSCLVVVEEAELRDDELGVVQLILLELLLQKVAAVRLA